MSQNLSERSRKATIPHKSSGSAVTSSSYARVAPQKAAKLWGSGSEEEAEVGGHGGSQRRERRPTLTRAKSDNSLAMAVSERAQLERRFTDAREEEVKAKATGEEAGAEGRDMDGASGGGGGGANGPAEEATEPPTTAAGEPSGAPDGMGRLTRAEALE